MEFSTVENKEYYHLRKSLVILVTRILIAQVITAIITLFITFSYVSLEKIIPSPNLFSFSYASLMIGLQSINLGSGLLIFLSWLRHFWIIKSHEIVEQQGVWSIDEDIFSTSLIEEVKVSQSLWGRIFNFGTLKICNPLLRKDFKMSDISDPHYYAALIRGMSGMKESVAFLPRQQLDGALVG